MAQFEVFGVGDVLIHRHQGDNGPCSQNGTLGVVTKVHPSYYLDINVMCGLGCWKGASKLTRTPLEDWEQACSK